MKSQESSILTDGGKNGRTQKYKIRKEKTKRKYITPVGAYYPDLLALTGVNIFSSQTRYTRSD